MKHAKEERVFYFRCVIRWMFEASRRGPESTCTATIKKIVFIQLGTCYIILYYIVLYYIILYYIILYYIILYYISKSNNMH